MVQEQVQQVAVNAPVAITTLDTAFQGIAQSQEMFPVDFEQAWKWIGYSTKGNAKRGVLSTLIAGVDYSLITGDKQKGRGGHNAEVIRLSVDGFKQFCMMAKTERGREVRLHYLELSAQDSSTLPAPKL